MQHHEFGPPGSFSVVGDWRYRQKLKEWQTQMEMKRFKPFDALLFVQEEINGREEYPPFSLLGELLENRDKDMDRWGLAQLVSYTGGCFDSEDLGNFIEKLYQLLSLHYNPENMVSKLGECFFCWRTVRKVQSDPNLLTREWVCDVHSPGDPLVQNPDRRAAVRLAKRVAGAYITKGRPEGWRWAWMETVGAREANIFSQKYEIQFSDPQWQDLLAKAEALDPLDHDDMPFGEPSRHRGPWPEYGIPGGIEYKRWWAHPGHLLARHEAIQILSHEHTRKVWIQTVPRENRGAARQTRDERKRYALGLVLNGEKSYREAAEEAGLGKGFAGTLFRMHRTAISAQPLKKVVYPQ